MKYVSTVSWLCLATLARLCFGAAPAADPRRTPQRRGVRIGSGVRVATLEGSGKGVIANGDIKRGDRVVSTPRELTLSASWLDNFGPPEQVAKSFAVDRRSWYALGSRSKLALKLAAAWLDDDDNGAAAEHAGARLTPRGRVDALPVHWSDDELALLCTPQLLARVETRRGRRRALLQLEATAEARQALDAAADAVATRALGGRLGARGAARLLVGAAVVAGVFEALTFAAGGEISSASDVALFLTVGLALLGVGVSSYRHTLRHTLYRHTLGIDVVATREIREADQICFSYTGKGNDSLLLDWGFVTDNLNDSRQLFDGDALLGTLPAERNDALRRAAEKDLDLLDSHGAKDLLSSQTTSDERVRLAQAFRRGKIQILQTFLEQ
ncbi:hypothetical protein M885DRAFT_497597 [Pelagophyceae sp. CCMP2097]|nr:hypothetical protein M885DRAFT_497597 [Pelagophyceae sp. CCMP2097]